MNARGGYGRRRRVWPTGGAAYRWVARQWRFPASHHSRLSGITKVAGSREPMTRGTRSRHCVGLATSTKKADTEWTKLLEERAQLEQFQPETGAGENAYSTKKNVEWAYWPATLLISFNCQERDVVGLRDSLSELFHRIEELLFENVTSQRSLLPNNFQQCVLSEHFLALVLRVRKSVGIHHQNVSFTEVELTGLIRGVIEHPQGVMVGDEPFDLSRESTKHPCRIMARADELPRSALVQEE
jgi:hypothetical protein